MEEEKLDMVLVPLGLVVFGLYHVWLLFTLKRFPRNTVIGINAESRHQWIFSLMANKHDDDIAWTKPVNGFIKLNFDGSKLNNGNAALGYTIRDYDGKVLLLGAKACGQASVLLAETLGLREGIISAKTLGFNKLAIEGDNMCVINSIRGTWKVPWEIASVIADIREELTFFTEDPLKNGVLAVQTIRNNMMASTLLATTAITMSSIIVIFVSNTSNVTSTSSMLIYGNKSPLISSVKYFTLILCFLVAFLCNVQSIRYYAHVSFLSTVPTSEGRRDQSMEYAARCLNRGSLFWSLGLRAFYLSFPLFLWIFGPIPMFVCSCIMSIVLYFLDTTTSFTRQLHSETLKEKHNSGLESRLTV